MIYYYKRSCFLKCVSVYVKMEMKVVNDEVKLNKQKIASLERRISNSMSNSRGMHDNLELSLVMFTCTQVWFPTLCSSNYIHIILLHWFWRCAALHWNTWATQWESVSTWGEQIALLCVCSLAVSFMLLAGNIKALCSPLNGKIHHSKKKY